ncbi:hypothetical protein B484DRAFT_389183, partial [Ochromonadaceae sp. CCMP2298]
KALFDEATVSASLISLAYFHGFLTYKFDEESNSILTSPNVIMQTVFIRALLPGMPEKWMKQMEATISSAKPDMTEFKRIAMLGVEEVVKAAGKGQQDQSLDTGALFPLLSRLPPPDGQNDLSPEIALVTSFVHSLSGGKAAWQPERADLVVLAWAASVFTGMGSGAHVSWFGEYGCALLATTPRVGEVVLMLAKARTGDKRSANHNEQGNQKTPALVQATWPLVRAVLQVLLESRDRRLLYRVAMAELQMWCTERALSVDSAEGSNAAIQMLKTAVAESAALADEGHDMGGFEARCVLARDLVETYRLAVAQLQQSKTGAALLSVEVKSRELLVVWVAFCVAHRATRISSPLLGEYKAAPQWQNLQNLVLSERRAVDSALHVAAYLRGVDGQGGRPVFSLLCDDATIDLAKRCATADQSMQ